jgi:hypothetical protein
VCEFGDALALNTTPDSQGAYIAQLPITLSTGNHFFFVYANDATDKISVPAVGDDLNTWMKKVLSVDYSAGEAPADITAANKFLLGTLWKEEETAPANGTTQAPKVVRVEIGRLASKVVLTGVTKGTGTSQGDFSDPFFRLGTLANAIHYAGVIDPVTTYNPYAVNVLVTSAKHKASYLNENEDGFNTADFTENTTMSWVAVAGEGTEASPYAFRYATENTTARMTNPDNAAMGEVQFYGNTTYVQLRTVYQPAMEETHNADGTDATVRLGKGATFHVGYANGVRYIFNDTPNAGLEIEGHLVKDVVTYTQGYNYHKFPIHDPLEGDAIYKNRVLRNHYYEYAVSAIKDLGDWDQKVDPKEPIEEETTIELAVTVRDWDKVTGTVIVR